MNYLSVCSGIEAATVAWHPLGWKPVGFAEIEPFPAAVLAHHYPTVPNFGDMTQLHDLIEMGICDAPEILVGGTPCQAFSVAGLRKSLDDDRGNLALVYCDLANAIDARRKGAGLPPAILVWENVPGVLSTKDNAFGCFLAGLAGEDEPLVPTGKRWQNAGYVLGPQRAVAWRILDAQYFGLAQRRRRVFVVASARDGFDPAAVLFEWEGVRRDSAPSRGAGQNSADRPVSSLDASFGRLQGCSGQDANHGHSHLVAFGGNNQSGPIEVATARNASASASGRLDFETETFLVQAVGFDASEDDTWRCTPLAPIAFPGNLSGTQCAASVDLAPAMGATNPTAVAFAENSRAEVRLEGGDGLRCGALSAGGGKPGPGAPRVAQAMQIRRLIPVECERLQGFPGGYTDIPWRRGKLDAFITGDECPDGPRYKALGNSMAVPCVHWIGARIDAHIKGELPSPCEAFL